MKFFIEDFFSKCDQIRSTLSVLEIFKIDPDFLGHVGKRLDKKAYIILKFMTSSTV